MQNAKEMQVKKGEINVGDEQVHAVQQDRTSVAAISGNVFNVEIKTTHQTVANSRMREVSVVGRLATLGECAEAGKVEQCRLYVTRWWRRGVVKPLDALSTQQRSDPITVEVSINGENVCMEVD